MSTIEETFEVDFTGRSGIHRGATFTRHLYFKNPDGSALDLTDYTAEWQARLAPGGSAVIDEAPAVTAGEGKVTLTLTSTQTAAIAAGTYEHGVRLTYTGGEPKYLSVVGRVSVKGSVVA